MATLDALKRSLRASAEAAAILSGEKLTDSQYNAGFDLLLGDEGQKIYQDFIIPQLAIVLRSLLKTRTSLSVLEIGPGPKSVLGSLSGELREAIDTYAAFEPNLESVRQLQKWMLATEEDRACPLPRLHASPAIFDCKFSEADDDYHTRLEYIGRFDLVLCCHSLYGVGPKRRFVEHALKMLKGGPQDGHLVIFHRDESLKMDGLVSIRTVSWPNGTISVIDHDEILDLFAPFVAGFSLSESQGEQSVKAEWRRICRDSGLHDQKSPGSIRFSSPETMVMLSRHATALPQLTAEVQEVTDSRKIKNREACLLRPAPIVRPLNIRQLQHCIRWALVHSFGLTVIGGSHSGQCVWPNTVAIDMSAFDKLQVLMTRKDGVEPEVDHDAIVLAEAGCSSGGIISRTMEEGLAVPLGARPSVGAGLWLQGGIGHLSRRYGLTSDALVGAIIVSVASAEVIVVGNIPSEYWPTGAVRSCHESELLWALKGAGTNFGVVVCLAFKACPAPVFSVRNRVLLFRDDRLLQRQISLFDAFTASTLPRFSSVDAYLYWQDDSLCLGVTRYDSWTDQQRPEPLNGSNSAENMTMDQLPQGQTSAQIADCVQLFDTEMYMSTLHGGHGGSRTSSFKRCLFLKEIRQAEIAERLVAAIKCRPLPLCYIHLLQGGGAVRDIEAEATAFGVRDWDFACVITGVWPRDEDSSEAARAAIQWVYKVVDDLLPLSCGVYSADLGPDPRDALLARKSFGPNLERLIKLKRIMDPASVLAYACPLPKSTSPQKLIVLVTGHSGVGKDYCADLWSRVMRTSGLMVQTTSISDEAKRRYAAASGADFSRLLKDRCYKEQHRPLLTKYFQDQLRQRPSMLEERFLEVVRDAMGVDVLLVTGMRERDALATYSPMVSDCKIIEVQIEASSETQQARLRYSSATEGNGDRVSTFEGDLLQTRQHVFNNDSSGEARAVAFCEDRLIPLCSEDIERLRALVPVVQDFPRHGIDFRHILNIVQCPGGLDLCVSLMKRSFSGDWAKVDMLATCEAGGFVFASALALEVGKPLALIRKTGKLPRPVVSTSRTSSHISATDPGDIPAEFELGEDVLSDRASIVMIDDVFATGNTLCSALRLLSKRLKSVYRVHVMTVAELPAHRGRRNLQQQGFGLITVQSLLTFDGR